MRADRRDNRLVRAVRGGARERSRGDRAGRVRLDRARTDSHRPAGCAFVALQRSAEKTRLGARRRHEAFVMAEAFLALASTAKTLTENKGESRAAFSFCLCAKCAPNFSLEL